MFSHLRPALTIFAAMTLITGVAYPLLVTGVAQAAFHDQANGSLIEREGTIVGSKLIGQSFEDPKYFWGRLSATLDADGKPLPYNAAISGGSNLGPSNPALAEAARARIDALRAADPENLAAVPIDLVTASGSGLDPDISPAAAEYQVHRVARARHQPEDRVRQLVAEHTPPTTMGVLVPRRLNVLELNLALADIK